MVKNETGKPNQSESKKASGIIDFLEIVLRLKKSEEFSDKQMILNLSHSHSHNTVRNIRKMLEDKKIIKNSKTSVNNEKFFKIINKTKANQVYKLAINAFVSNRKNNPSVVFTPTKIFRKSTSKINYVIRLEINGKQIKKWSYPKSKYQKKICPICDEKLIEFKHVGSSHDLDKKCIICKSKFYYHKPETKNSKDDVIVTNVSADISKYFVGNLVKKSRIDKLQKEAKKIMISKN